MFGYYFLDIVCTFNIQMTLPGQTQVELAISGYDFLSDRKLGEDRKLGKEIYG